MALRSQHRAETQEQSAAAKRPETQTDGLLSVEHALDVAPTPKCRFGCPARCDRGAQRERLRERNAAQKQKIRQGGVARIREYRATIPRLDSGIDQAAQHHRVEGIDNSA